MISYIFFIIILVLDSHVENFGFYNATTLQLIQLLTPCIIATGEYTVFLEIAVVLYKSLKDDTFLG